MHCAADWLTKAVVALSLVAGAIYGRSYMTSAQAGQKERNECVREQPAQDSNDL